MKATRDEIHAFLQGSNPMERVIKIEGAYNDDRMHVYYRDEDGRMNIRHEPFYPFVWCTQARARALYDGSKKKLLRQMAQYGIGCRGLRVEDDKGHVHERMENGYRVMFYSKRSMPYLIFNDFFRKGGCPISAFTKKKDGKNKETDPKNGFLSVSPVEQFMISSGIRFFKGYNDYDDLLRMQWDLETEGLDPKVDAISQIGIRTNRGYEEIITIDGEGEEKKRNEILALDKFFKTIRSIRPDVISGHNTENFDWNFIDVRLMNLGLALPEFTKGLFGNRGVYKKKDATSLKLGAEVEYFYQTVMPGYNLTDSLFAVRRAQAIDSNMKRADLKYVTQFSKLNKPNRVYVQGKIINDTWSDLEEHYAFNDENGHWFKVDDELLSRTFTDDDGKVHSIYSIIGNKEKIIDNRNKEEFVFKSGRYIVQRYLLDDLWETDKVEHRYNLSNFLIAKLIPTSFEKACIMGTAGIWKFIMMAWSYEKGLAIPESIPQRTFVGGLSRLLQVGFVDRVVKLDYNSLYPSILLSFNIATPIDLSGAMLTMLDYILSQREHYKGLKENAGKEIDRLRKEKKILSPDNTSAIKNIEKEIEYYAEKKALNDKLQLPLKILANSFFGSYGSGEPFPWSDIDCAEEVTCTGRMMLRLMIKHFKELGYKPIVGDSFSGDTPLFVKYKDNGLVDIKNVSEIFDEYLYTKDALNREYDTSEKPYLVLSLNGWQEVKYVYRHRTEKPLYRLTDDEMVVDVTEDHSIFDSHKNKIKPTQLTENTKLLYVEYDMLISNILDISIDHIENCILGFNAGILHSIPAGLLNAKAEYKRIFLDGINLDRVKFGKCSKKLMAQIKFIQLSSKVPPR